MNDALTKILSDLKQHLRYGDYSVIANRLKNISVTDVTKAFAGQSVNYDKLIKIVNETKKLIKERKAELKKLEKETAELLNGKEN